MADQTSAQYFRMRAADEWRLSEDAADFNAAAAHANIAIQYEEMAARFEAMQKSANPASAIVSCASGLPIS